MHAAFSTGALLMILLLFASDYQWCGLTSQGSAIDMQHIVSVESSLCEPNDQISVCTVPLQKLRVMLGL